MEIRKNSLHQGFSLDFFQIDDEEFEYRFSEEIEKERIFIVGQSKEETLYRILNEIKNKYPSRKTLVIKNQKDWKLLEKTQINEYILIPFFYSENIMSISNNTNIFIYREDEPCYYDPKLKLRRRTRSNIIHCLEEVGLDLNDAYKIVEKTHGLFVHMKKYLFSSVSHNNPVWRQYHSKAVMAALLCGKWVESEGDILIFESISGEEYGDSKKELTKYSNVENPYIIEVNGFSGKNMQIASIEDAWEELKGFISDEMWDEFINCFYGVMIERDPIFEYPFDKHFFVSLSIEKPYWSSCLKNGMIRTLIMYIYYGENPRRQKSVDAVVKKILNSIKTKEDWGYISQYITDLCEASPKAVIERLENELHNSTGLVDLFSAEYGDTLTARYYYSDILWAVEQLLQQKLYATRAMKWLWSMSEYNIKYPITNSPNSILKSVFCPWINVSVLDAEDKIRFAQLAVKEYSNVWEVIYSNLPTEQTYVSSYLITPKYRQTDESGKLSGKEIVKIYIEYLWICIDLANVDVDKWIKLIDRLELYTEEIQKNVLDKLVIQCKKMNNYDKIKIRDKIRALIYKHRHFSDAKWSMEEKCIKNYENAFFSIPIEKDEYEFLYLFVSDIDFPLLYPFSCTDEANREENKNKNRELREKEITNQMTKFITEDYSIEKLIELVIKEDRWNLGMILGEFYCGKKYSNEIMELLLKYDKNGKHICNYIGFLLKKSVIDLKEMVKKVEEKIDNDGLIVNLILLESIENYQNSIIANESEKIKQLYWKQNLIFVISNKAEKESCLWALNECIKYGTLNSYIILLHQVKEKLTKKELYDYIYAIENLKNDYNYWDVMANYYLKELLEPLQNSFINDLEKCQKIAMLEWKCRNILTWNEMKCIQHRIKNDPVLYADLVKTLCVSDYDTEEISRKKIDIVNKFYSGFEAIKFCPTEENGNVDYELLEKWICKFKILLVKHGQSKVFNGLLGRLLAYSPIGNDGYMPCEAVRKIIEKYHNDSLKDSYIAAELNKRGVHTLDDGKSEMKLSKKYMKNSKVLQKDFPFTAEIYSELSDRYEWKAEWHRRQAEDEF